MNEIIDTYENILFNRILKRLIVYTAIIIIPVVILLVYTIIVNNSVVVNNTNKYLKDKEMIEQTIQLHNYKLFFLTKKVSIIESGVHRHPKTWHSTCNALQQFDIEIFDLLRKTKENNGKSK